MKINFKKISKIFVFGIFVFFVLPTTIAGQTSYPLGISAKMWDIGSDNNNNVFVMWCIDGEISVGRISHNQVVDRELAATKVSINKYTVPRLAVSPDGSSVSIIYMSGDRQNVRHAWRNSGGSWQNERIFGPKSSLLYFPAVAVSLDGTVHASWAHGGEVRYSYKKPGKSWVYQDSLEEVGTQRTILYADPLGGVHITWMSYTDHITYRYAAPGKTLDTSISEIVTVEDKGGDSRHPFVVGNGDIFASKSGIVGMPVAARGLFYFTHRLLGEKFSKPSHIIRENFETEIESNLATGVDYFGKFFCAWGQGEEKVNSVKLATFDKGAWQVKTLDKRAFIDEKSKPAITINDFSGYILWRHTGGELFLANLPITPLIHVSSTSVTSITERSFFGSYKFNQVTWQDDPLTSEHEYKIDHYNVYRKKKTDVLYGTTPLVSNIPASIHTFDDVSDETNKAEQIFDYYITTVILIDGKLFESPITY